jgi:hypothetical protein
MSDPTPTTHSESLLRFNVMITILGLDTKAVNGWMNRTFLRVSDSPFYWLSQPCMDQTKEAPIVHVHHRYSFHADNKAAQASILAPLESDS